MTPDEIEELFHNIPEDEESKIQMLKQIRGTVKKLQETNSPELEALVEKIGDGSRQGTTSGLVSVDSLTAIYSVYVVFICTYGDLTNFSQSDGGYHLGNPGC